VGEPAGQAAQAVRRAGLRPGLDRSFGCAPELVGQVVAQEPPAGGELPRNGLVTLFVAAPGAGPQETVEPAANVTPRPSEDEPSPRARRRRKRGLAGGAPRIAPSPPPAPVLSAQRPQLKHGHLTAIFKLGPRTAGHALIRVSAKLDHESAVTSTLHRHAARRPVALTLD